MFMTDLQIVTILQLAGYEKMRITQFTDEFALPIEHFWNVGLGANGERERERDTGYWDIFSLKGVFYRKRVWQARKGLSVNVNKTICGRNFKVETKTQNPPRLVVCLAQCAQWICWHKCSAHHWSIAAHIYHLIKNALLFFSRNKFGFILKSIQIQMFMYHTSYVVRTSNTSEYLCVHQFCKKLSPHIRGKAWSSIHQQSIEYSSKRCIIWIGVLDRPMASEKVNERPQFAIFAVQRYRIYISFFLFLSRRVRELHWPTGQYHNNIHWYKRTCNVPTLHDAARLHWASVRQRERFAM